MKKFKEYISEDYDVYLDMVKKIHGLSGGKADADEKDDLYSPPTKFNYSFNTMNQTRSE